MTDWKSKLAAYLHDPPSKCLDIKNHGERSDAAFRQAGFTDQDVGKYTKSADHTAAAADRFPFPISRVSGLRCAFDGVKNGFLHPLSGGKFPFENEFKSAELGIEGENTVQPVLASVPMDWSEDLQWRARFFAHWRLWQDFAKEKDYRLGFLPADTRIPDHTIWTHMQIVSALDGCINDKQEFKPAFLKFQLGPVQEFIAQARSTRDLWSGSYLLSWLMAAGLKKLSELIGPDAVIFPNLSGQPLFDLHWKDELWSKVGIGDQSVWETLREKAKQSKRENVANNDEMDILTPNMPNVFLAIVPAEQADNLGKIVKEAIESEWKVICDSVWAKVKGSGLLDLCPPNLKENGRAKDRFETHTKKFLSCSWHALSWPDSIEKAREMACLLPEGKCLKDEKTVLKRYEEVIDAATKEMPKDHRDGRYYVGENYGPKDKLNNVGIAWSLLNAVNGWSLDAVRQTHNFNAWQVGGWQDSGVGQSKDALTGREEMIFGGKGFSDTVQLLEDQEWKALFRHDDEIGAITLVKRVWHWSYLADKRGLKAMRDQFPMPNTRTMADHRPFEDDAEENLETENDDIKGGKYYAVLALDGDQIGKWVSGDKTPHYKTQFAAYSDGSGTAHGALAYFESKSNPDNSDKTLQQRFHTLLDTRRLVSPSYHLQLSETLSNFALLCARRIVEAYDGRLIYAGGDDVLAMIPADCAVDCAKALRQAFQGKKVITSKGEVIFDSTKEGFLKSETRKDECGEPIPFIVPGPAADCSVGIAIAHFKDPLQDVVREAQAAEKRAKKDVDKGGYGRSAIAITLMKRSGETIEWGCKWDSGGLLAYDFMMMALQNDFVSSKFPHSIVELVKPYQAVEGQMPLGEFEKVIDEILEKEVGLAAERQRGQNYDPTEVCNIQTAIDKYLKKLNGVDAKIHSLIGLCQTVAFIERNLPKKPSSTQSKAERQEANV